MVDWDADSSLLAQNLEAVLTAARASATARDVPTLAMARAWHSTMMAGLEPTPPARASWFGRFRGESGQELVGVRIGPVEGTHPQLVATELSRLEDRLADLVARLDRDLPTDADLSAGDVDVVLSLMSWIHNEWVRIHPFANGNGRIARVWANWVAMRYGLPPFVRLRPRPSGDSYTQAAGAAMSGQVLAMVPVFREMLLSYPAEGGAET